MSTGNPNSYKRLSSRTVSCPAGENFVPWNVPTKTGTCRVQYCFAPSKTN